MQIFFLQYDVWSVRPAWTWWQKFESKAGSDGFASQCEWLSDSQAEIWNKTGKSRVKSLISKTCFQTFWDYI